jgi:hypothetical protein
MKEELVFSPDSFSIKIVTHAITLENTIIITFKHENEQKAIALTEKGANELINGLKFGLKKFEN